MTTPETPKTPETLRRQLQKVEFREFREFREWGRRSGSPVNSSRPLASWPRQRPKWTPSSSRRLPARPRARCVAGRTCSTESADLNSVIVANPSRSFPGARQLVLHQPKANRIRKGTTRRCRGLVRLRAALRKTPNRPVRESLLGQFRRMKRIPVQCLQMQLLPLSDKEPRSRGKPKQDTALPFYRTRMEPDTRKR